MASDPSSSPTRHDAFQSTRWSLVMGAQGRSSRDPAASLESLCRQYWPPLYAYARRCGYSCHDSQDLTQAFFVKLLEKDWLATADATRGRLRAFLLMAMKRFMANEWDRSQARKRGGGASFVSFDADENNPYQAADAPSVLPPESAYDLKWALTVMEATMRRLHQEYESGGKSAEYELLKPYLVTARGETDYETLAASLQMRASSARSALHRLRKRFREIFRNEVADTVATAEEIDDEMRAVIAALGNAE